MSEEQKNMADINYAKLDKIIHSRARLGIMAALAAVKEELDFNFFQEKIGLTDGNLASHLRKLEDAGYVKVKKTFVRRRPRTSYSLTKTGIAALKDYVSTIEKIITDIR